MSTVHCERSLARQVNEMTSNSSGVLASFRVALGFDIALFLKEVQSRSLVVVPCSDGEYATISETESTDDYSKQSRDFYFHTDGLYHRRIPEIAVLYCVRETLGTTKTVFIDTREVVHALDSELALLEKLDVVYIGRDKALNKSRLVDFHPVDGARVLSYGSRAFLMPNTDYYPVSDFPNIEEITRIGQKLLNAIQAAQTKEFVLPSSSVLIFDNLRYLHARVAPKVDLRRKVLRVWLSRKRQSVEQQTKYRASQ